MSSRRLLALLVAVLFAGSPVLAQDYDRPPPGFDEDSVGGPYGRAAPRERLDTPDAGSLAVRVSKLEGRLRELTGEIEELQNANRKLVEQLQKFQGDVDARLAGGARQKRGDAEPAPRAADRVAESAPPADGDAPKARKPRRDDSFDPDATAAAGAPGKPRPLGSASSAQPDDNGSKSGSGSGGGPVDLSGGRFGNDGQDAGALAPTLRLPSAAPRQGAAAPAPGGPAAAPSGPRAEFDAALALFRDKQYEDAEKGFTAFIGKNPKSRLVADATYYLGESFAQRGRSREAAEQYLKISTDYSTSTRAPDAMLHLGMSLKAIGAKEQACATFSEVTRKYPNAPAYVRNGAEREAKRAQC